MKKDKAINRLTGFFDEGIEKMRDAGGELEERFMRDAKVIASRARAGLKQSRDKFSSAESSVVQAMKDHPQIFILAAVSLLGLFVAKLLFDQIRSAEIIDEMPD